MCPPLSDARSSRLPFLLNEIFSGPTLQASFGMAKTGVVHRYEWDLRQVAYDTINGDETIH